MITIIIMMVMIVKVIAIMIMTRIMTMIMTIQVIIRALIVIKNGLGKLISETSGNISLGEIQTTTLLGFQASLSSAVQIHKEGKKEEKN